MLWYISTAFLTTPLVGDTVLFCGEGPGATIRAMRVVDVSAYGSGNSLAQITAIAENEVCYTLLRNIDCDN